MADKPIGQLPVSAGLDDNSLLVMEQGGEARSITGALVKQFAKDAVAEDVSRAEQAAKDATEAKTSVDTTKDAIDQTKADIDQTKTAIDGIKTDIDTAKTAIDQAQTDVAKNKTDAEAAAQSAGTSAAAAAENAGRVAAALEEADGIVEEVTGLRDEAMNTVKSAVLFTEQQLTDAQKEQARANIGSFYDKGPSGAVKWNGATSNLVSITVNAEPELGYAGETYYLMPRTSSNVPSAASLEALGGSYTYQTGAEEMGESGIVPELGTVLFGAGNGNLDSDSYPGATIVGDMVIVVHEPDIELYDIVVEKPGVYFRKYFQSPNFYQTQVTEMTLTGGTLDDGLERLPKKFLPEGVAMEGYVDDKIDEASPFLVTLTDGKANCTMAELWVRRNDRAEVYLLDASGRRLHMTEVREEEIPVRNNEGEIIRYRYEYYATFALALSSFPALAEITLYGSSLGATATVESYSTKTLIATDGGTMTGALTLNGDPTEAKHAATKQYVDEKATWENLQGKPTIFEGGDTLTWDGDTEGKTLVFDMGYKVSDATPTLSDTGNGVTMTMDNGAVIPSSAIVCEEAEGLLMFNVEGVPYAFVVHAYEDLPTGTYLTAGVSSLTIPGYTGFGKEVIDPDYLPESVKDTGVEWVKFTIGEELGNGTFSATADKTMKEIISLVEAGKVVTAEIVDPGMITRVPLTLCCGDLISFSTVFYAGAAMMMVLTMTKDITYSQTISITTAAS